MNAIITGASKGIGKAIALEFASRGINLILSARSKDDLEKTAYECQAKNKDIIIHLFSADISKREDIRKLGEFCLLSFDKINILVNNAGVFIPGHIHKEEEGNLEKMMDTNLYSAYHLTRALLPSMISEKQGHIFNMCSVASKFAYPNGGSYSISKFALLGFSKVLREELKDKGIRVTAILPGATWSNSWKGVDLPKNRLMDAGDIAKVIWNAFEISDNAVVEEIVLRPQEGDLP